MLHRHVRHNWATVPFSWGTVEGISSDIRLTLLVRGIDGLGHAVFQRWDPENVMECDHEGKVLIYAVENLGQSPEAESGGA